MFAAEMTVVPGHLRGVQRTGVVADSVELPDGTVAIRWRGVRASTVIWDEIRAVKAFHGHAGAARVVSLDDVDEDLGTD